MHDAVFYRELDENRERVECLLCPHKCYIHSGKSGICKCRVNIAGKLYSKSYGKVTSLAIDPVEKKPLYHFYPSRNILSLGSYGCNLQCEFCQNWQISQQEIAGSEYKPSQIVKTALEKNLFAIAYTYNEPLINYEFVYETAALAYAVGVKNVLVTNGFINREPLEQLLPYISGVNLDIKAGNNNFYRDVCGGYLEPVLKSARILACAQDVHLEVTTLLIPGYNDDAQELQWLSKWVAENCGKETPAHISAYFPSYKFDAKPTGREDILKAVDIFRGNLDFVYAGNISFDSNSTYCKDCGAELVRRKGYETEIVGLDSAGWCINCSAGNNFVL